MSDETRRVLDLLAQGKIKVDEADRLLAALGQASTESAPTEPAGKGAATSEAPAPKFLRITVTKNRSGSGDDEEHGRRTWMGLGMAAGKEVTIRVPVALVRNGMRLGAMIPGIAGGDLQARLRERGVDIDLSKIDADTIDRLVNEFGEMNIDVSGHKGNAKVRITCE